jgi:TPR repeat protein
MFKYFLFGLLATLNIAALHAVDVEMQAAADTRRAVAPSITAAQICQSILASTPLLDLPPESIPVERLKRWSRESVIASLYYYAVTAVESVNPTHDMNQAKAWYAKAALSGEPYAFYRLALIFIKRDNQEALGLILMQAAADKNYYDARVYLGLEKEDY